MSASSLAYERKNETPKSLVSISVSMLNLTFFISFRIIDVLSLYGGLPTIHRRLSFDMAYFSLLTSYRALWLKNLAVGMFVFALDTAVLSMSLPIF